MSLITRVIPAAAGLMFLSAPAIASCLTEVGDFALRICGEIEKSGSHTIVDEKGNLDANVSSIIRRIVGGGAAGISGEKLVETYTNVAQKELGTVIFNVLECRQKMVPVAVDQACKRQAEEKTWISPSVSVMLSEHDAESLAGGGRTISKGNRGCFAPPDTPEAEKDKGNWRFSPDTASIVEEQHSCNSNQTNVGGMVLAEKSPTNICLDVGARPAQQGVYSCTTTAHFSVKITR